MKWLSLLPQKVALITLGSGVLSHSCGGLNSGTENEWVPPYRSLGQVAKITEISQNQF